MCGDIRDYDEEGILSTTGAQAPERAAATEVALELRAEQPAKLRRQLYRAMLELDLDESPALIERIAKYDAAAGRALQTY